MNIAAYRFGSIEIDGHTYTSDVIITPERVVDSWWRQQGHSLAVADLADVVAARPEVLVIGTGCWDVVPRTRGTGARHSGARSAHERGGAGLQSAAEGAQPSRRGAASDVLTPMPAGSPDEDGTLIVRFSRPPHGLTA
jgi:hypothetical protein